MKQFFSDLMSRPGTAWSKMPPLLRNKFVLSGLIFAIWLAFFDQNDLHTQYKLKEELNQLVVEKAYYMDKLEEAKADLEELQSNDAKLEKFARENYYMKRDNEDIFVIVPEED